VNANDLADRLEQFYSGSHIQKAAEVLRQQQTEIEDLKASNGLLQAKLNYMYIQDLKK
jgi:hypothetical protein